MKFSDLISPSQIILELDAADRWATIDEMVNHLVRLGRVAPSERETVLTDVKNREKTISTGVGFGIAIPHGSTRGVEKVAAIFGRSSKGINFDALDNQPVRLVVLFLVPLGQYQVHLKTLALISRFLNDREFRERALQAASEQEIYDAIVKRES
ncbi:MAG: PTS sugar transporter subunit IIA [Verrucomicrobiae bacterium]|nr:PTS sugar transporter subunit IIA [Verrucomicrobiae bacterium]